MEYLQDNIRSMKVMLLQMLSKRDSTRLDGQRICEVRPKRTAFVAHQPRGRLRPKECHQRARKRRRPVRCRARATGCAGRCPRESRRLRCGSASSYTDQNIVTQPEKETETETEQVRQCRQWMLTTERDIGSLTVAFMPLPQRSVWRRPDIWSHVGQPMKQPWE